MTSRFYLDSQHRQMDSHLMASFQDNLGKPASEMLNQSGF